MQACLENEEPKCPSPISRPWWILLLRLLSTLIALLALTTAEAAPPDGMGPLAVHSDNPRYFADPKGRTVWLTGSHTWAFFQERGIEGETPDFEYQRYLDFLQQRGHNFLRLWMWEHAQWMQFADRKTPVRYAPLAYQRTGPGMAMDGKPKFDLTKFNEKFFERLRARVEAAGERGIYVGVMFFQGFSVDKTRGDAKKGNAWHGLHFIQRTTSTASMATRAAMIPGMKSTNSRCRE